MKQERLTEVLKTMMRAARSVNGDIKFGIPLHTAGLESPGMALAKCSYDMKTFQDIKVDYYWISVPHRDIRASRKLNYKKGMEALSQITQAAAAAVRDPFKTIIVLQTTTVAGKVLPFSEIEEVTALARKGENICVAYRVAPDGLLPASLTKKMFKPQAQKQ